MKLEKTWNPKHWASWKPFGFGEQRPNNYLELTRAIWENRDELSRAWRILNEGVCDGCALGTKGLSDWTLPGPHLCNIRLRLLRLNTMPPFDLNLLSDISSLKTRAGEDSGQHRMLEDIRIGLGYVWSNRAVRDPIVLLGLLSLTVINFPVITPDRKSVV